MDLALTALTLALASVLFLPLDPSISRLLHVAVVVLLAILLLLKIMRPKKTAEPEKPPVRADAQQAAPPLAPEAQVEAGVVQFLARMQEKGRLVDFLMDDIAPYSNEQIGVVARVVHQGCREVLRGAFDIEPVHGGQEREEVTLAGDFDAAAYRLVGKVPQRPPYTGTILHRGWKATRISLPRVSDTARDAAARKVIAPVEVEVA
jgi:hypothetical protein